MVEQGLLSSKGKWCLLIWICASRPCLQCSRLCFSKPQRTKTTNILTRNCHSVALSICYLSIASVQAKFQRIFRQYSFYLSEALSSLRRNSTMQVYFTCMYTGQMLTEFIPCVLGKRSKEGIIMLQLVSQLWYDLVESLPLMNRVYTSCQGLNSNYLSTISHATCAPSMYCHDDQNPSCQDVEPWVASS